MSTRKRDIRWLVLLALFAAIEIFLNVTGIGLIPLPLIKASTLHIPVIIGAVLLGPLAGGILGGVFGLCSIWSNTTAPGLLSFAFTPALATSLPGAVKTIWIALGCRILIGVVAGWLWIALKKAKVNDLVALPVVGGGGGADQHRHGDGQHLSPAQPGVRRRQEHRPGRGAHGRHGHRGGQRDPRGHRRRRPGHRHRQGAAAADPVRARPGGLTGRFH